MTPAARLLAWYDRHGRKLPWRQTHDPYRILVSEIMLQQTQVARVLFFYAKWLKQFPSWSALAKASNAEVIRAWSGLGYNRRALALRDIAKNIDEKGVPKNETEWLALKGIGPYTSAALAAFSLKQRTFPIDTNIRRTAGRLLLGTPFPEPKHDGRIQKAAETFLPKNGRFYDIPQALFDLATAICTKSPACANCPMRKDCKAAPKFLAGNIKIPKAALKKSLETKQAGKPFPDRIYRGRILKLVNESKKGILIKDIGPKIDPSFDTKNHDEAWTLRMVDRLEKDGLVKKRGARLVLED